MSKSKTREEAAEALRQAAEQFNTALEELANLGLKVTFSVSPSSLSNNAGYELSRLILGSIHQTVEF